MQKEKTIFKRGKFKVVFSLTPFQHKPKKTKHNNYTKQFNFGFLKIKIKY